MINLNLGEIIKIRELLKKQIKILKENNIEDATLKARMLLSFTIEKPKEYLIIHDEEVVEDNLIKKYEGYIKRILDKEPIQYIMQKQEFMKLDFFVNENVLIPRADTEILAEEALEIINQNKLNTVLDLCTGSGAIAISIAKYSNAKKILATDISKKALEVTNINIDNNKVNVQTLESNLFENIDEKFDIIVSNPPYIETEAIEDLAEDVKKEPIIALDGGKDGLEIYRSIIQGAHNFLEPGGFLCLEIGYNQKESVLNLIRESHKYKNEYSKKDLYGNDRIVVCRRG